MANKKIALVTGCNKGIGKAILKKFLKNNIQVICCVRKIDKGFKKFIKNEKNIINVLDFDITNHIVMKKKFQILYKKSSKIDILVNNAGAPSGSITEMTTVENLKNIFDINFFSQIKIIQYSLRLLKKSKNGSIINIGSISGLYPFKGNIAYGSSKAALMFATKVMSKEFADYNIRVNSVAPSVTNTIMAKLINKKSLNELLKKSKLKKPMSVNEVADKVLYLASDKSKTINGKIIHTLGDKTWKII